MRHPLACQEQLRAVILDRAPSSDDLRTLGAEAWRWLTYRRLVRSRLYETIDHCFGQLMERLGAEAFHSLVDEFLADPGPRSPYLRDVPGEFLEWFEDHANRSGEAAGLPPEALDLARFECAQLETAYAEADSPAVEVAELCMDRPAVLSAAHRVLALRYPVHRVAAAASREAPTTGAEAFVCVYRDPRSFDVHTLELSSITAALLREMATADRPLVEVVQSVAGEHGALLDCAFVEALSVVLADLVERGVILGSAKREP